MNQQFFLVVTPGLEALAEIELHEKFPGLANCRPEKGGLEVDCPQTLGFAFNRHLKIPSMILWRIKSFKCRDLPKLFQVVSNIKWGQYLLNDEFCLNVSSAQSRMQNEKKIEKTVTEGITRHFQKQPPKKRLQRYKHEIYVRFFKDICTFSFNTSGELLFKRGYKTMSATAPIRENLAAALYFALHIEKSGVEVLLDPMCGSGTLLLEAAQFWQESSHRPFAFEANEALQAAIIQSPPLIENIKTYVGLDRSAKALQSFRENISSVHLGSHQEIQLYCRDFIKEGFGVLKGQARAIICNPPYNERLKLPLPPKDFYNTFFERALAVEAALIGLVVPKKYSQLLPNRLMGYEQSREYEFANGGINVTYKIYRRS